MQEQQSGIQVTEAVHGTYEQRKKAFKAAGKKRGSNFIPMTRGNQNFFPQAAQSNNRKETNNRGVNPRMLNIQRAPVQVTVRGIAVVDGVKTAVAAKVKTMQMRKIYHTRPVVAPVVVP